MANNPAFVGSPAMTATFEPAGSDGGPSVQARLAGVTMTWVDWVRASVPDPRTKSSEAIETHRFMFSSVLCLDSNRPRPIAAYGKRNAKQRASGSEWMASRASGASNRTRSRP